MPSTPQTRPSNDVGVSNLAGERLLRWSRSVHEEDLTALAKLQGLQRIDLAARPLEEDNPLWVLDWMKESAEVIRKHCGDINLLAFEDSAFAGRFLHGKLLGIL